MKKMTNIFTVASCSLALALSFSSCEGFLEEDNRSKVTSDNYLVDETSMDELVNGAYTTVRSAYNQYNTFFLGTDLFTRTGVLEGENSYNDYTNIRSDNGTTASLWGYFGHISKCNAVLTRLEEISELSESFKTLRKSEMLTLRSLYYFSLVQYYGGVPLVLEEIREVQSNYVRATEEEVYAQIISDLEFAVANLPTTSDDEGRVVKGVAQHLLAKVYLTRGYLSFAETTDFTKAIQNAEAVIAMPQYSLLNSHTELFDYDNQENSEVIFAAQFTTDNINNGSGNLKQEFMNTTCEPYPGRGRNSDTGRSTGPVPTNLFYDLLKDGDTRDDIVIRAVLANEAEYDDIKMNQLEIGDTLVYFPKVAWTDEQKAAVSYYVYNPDEYYDRHEYNTRSIRPEVDKFSDHVAPYSDPGYRDINIFRLAETYLFAAEAYYQNGNSGKALEMLNVVRARSTKPGYEAEMTATVIDEDVLLDEYALELIGETSRWDELKRMGKLAERVFKYNAHAKLHHTSAATIDDHYLLRPIPETEILLNEGNLTQNDGY